LVSMLVLAGCLVSGIRASGKPLPEVQMGLGNEIKESRLGRDGIAKDNESTGQMFEPPSGYAWPAPKRGA
jgi:hypothetical protein